MNSHFFPNEAFAWMYVGLLSLIILVAAWFDTRQMIIPKWLTYPMAALGLGVNVFRGAWVGFQGRDLWMLGPGNVWLGALDGFLFAFIGFLAGFALLLLMWLGKTCGGGDVKLFGGIGAWVGALQVFYVLLVSLPFLALLMTGKGVIAACTSKLRRTIAKQSRKRTGTESKAKRRVAYSLPVAIAVIIVLLWGYRFELNLETPHLVQQREVVTHAR